MITESGGHRRRRALMLQVVPARVHRLSLMVLLRCGGADGCRDGKEREEEEEEGLHVAKVTPMVFDC